MLRSFTSLSLSLDPRFPVPRASLPMFFWLIGFSQICALSANDRFFRTIMGLLASIRDIHKTQIESLTYCSGKYGHKTGQTNQNDACPNSKADQHIVMREKEKETERLKKRAEEKEMREKENGTADNISLVVRQPDGAWVKCQDEISGKPFYWDVSSGNTARKRPDGL